MSHFWIVLKTLKRCKSVCVRVRGMMLYIFLFIILSSIQRRNLFFIKMTSEKMARLLKFSRTFIFDCFWTFTFDPCNDKVCKQKWSCISVFNKSYILRTESSKWFSPVCSPFHLVDNLQTCILTQFETLKSEF